MKKNIEWTFEGWGHYLEWQNEDEKVVNKINGFIDEIMRTPFKGTGKPEPLKTNYSGYWSRRITLEHRLVYKVESNKIVIIDCKGHYEK